MLSLGVNATSFMSFYRKNSNRILLQADLYANGNTIDVGSGTIKFSGGNIHGNS